MGKEYFTVREVSKLLGIGSPTIIKYTDMGFIESAGSVGSGYLYTEEGIEAFKEFQLQCKENLLNAYQVGEMLGVCAATIYSYEEKGFFKAVPAVPLTARYYRKKDIEDYIEKCNGVYSAFPEHKYMDAKEVAKKLGVADGTLSSYDKRGITNPVRTETGRKYYLREEIQKLVEEQNSSEYIKFKDVAEVLGFRSDTLYRYVEGTLINPVYIPIRRSRCCGVSDFTEFMKGYGLSITDRLITEGEARIYMNLNRRQFKSIINQYSVKSVQLFDARTRYLKDNIEKLVVLLNKEDGSYEE